MVTAEQFQDFVSQTTGRYFSINVARDILGVFEYNTNIIHDGEELKLFLTNRLAPLEIGEMHRQAIFMWIIQNLA